MNDRPTPETDAEVIFCHGIPHGINPPERSYTSSKFARKLERERNEVREKAERYRLEANSLMLQRDEARESLKHIGEYGTEEINAAVELRQKLASALVERDEALIDRANGDIATMTINHYERILRERNMAEDERIDLAKQLRSEKESHAKCQNERDEARESAKELSDIASKYLSFLLATIPIKPSETHEKETKKVIDALKRWKKL